MDYLRKRPRNPILNPTAAQLKGYATAIRTKGRDGNQIAADFERAARAYEQLRVEFFAQDRSERAGLEPPAFMGETETTPSTFSVCQTLISCMKKGCLTDHLPFDKKYISLKPHPKSGLPNRMNKQESVKNESWHRLCNGVLKMITSIGEKLADQRLMLRIFRYNEDTDIKLGLKPAFPRLSYFQMARAQARAAGILKGTAFPQHRVPREVDESSRDEPFGFECLNREYKAQLTEMEASFSASAGVGVGVGLGAPAVGAGSNRVEEERSGEADDEEGELGKGKAKAKRRGKMQQPSAANNKPMVSCITLLCDIPFNLHSILTTPPPFSLSPRNLRCRRRRPMSNMYSS